MPIVMVAPYNNTHTHTQKKKKDLPPGGRHFLEDQLGEKKKKESHLFLSRIPKCPEQLESQCSPHSVLAQQRMMLYFSGSRRVRRVRFPTKIMSSLINIVILVNWSSEEYIQPTKYPHKKTLWDPNLLF